MTLPDGINLPPVVSQAEWQAAREKLLAKEKEATRASDALAAERRRQPMAEIEKEYVFDGPTGEVRLLEMFEGRPQLIVYHFMFEPGAAGWPDAGCDGCSMVVDQLPHLAHLHAREISFALVSRAPLDKLEAYRERMGWDVPWFSLAGNDTPLTTPASGGAERRRLDFNDDLGVGSGFGLSVFLRDGDRVYRTYYTSGRGVEMLGTPWAFFDRVPLGRQEDWEDSPEGYPQGPRYEWWRRHDEYEAR